MNWLALVASIFFSQSALAYPEMARTGYVNCNSCHVSLNGGGVLNDYGRQLSKEELAVWKNPDENSKEQESLYGLINDSPIQKWLKIGGDVRSVYYYVDSPAYKMGETILMQADLQLAAIKDRWTIVAAGGVSQDGPGQEVEFLTRNHYVQYELSDEIHFRGGKFIPAYGILTADHTTLTRDPLQLGYNFESYNLEASYISEKWNWFVTGILGRPDDSALNREQGFAIQGAYATSERVKFGLNTLYGKADTGKRWLFGGFAIAGITERLFGSTEVDVKSYIGGNHGVASTQKLSYELTEGLWCFGMQEYGTSNLPGRSQVVTEVYGLGVQFFPRTHFEFNLAYEKILRQAAGSDTLWFMSHFYL